MAKNGPILLIENDEEEKQLIQEALNNISVPNELKFFNDGSEALAYLESTEEKPFMILSNVHLQKINGIELRQKINENPQSRDKSIPFIFLTTDIRKETIKNAFNLTVQGYFDKANTLADLQKTLKLLIDYWTTCKHPNEG